MHLWYESCLIFSDCSSVLIYPANNYFKIFLFIPLNYPDQISFFKSRSLFCQYKKLHIDLCLTIININDYRVTIKFSVIKKLIDNNFSLPKLMYAITKKNTGNS